MTQAVGETVLKWLAQAAFPHTSNGPDATANGGYSPLSDELDLAALTPEGVLDILVSAKLKTASGSLGSNPFAQIVAAGRADGTNYPGVTGNYQKVGRGAIIGAANTTVYSPKFSLRSAFGGVLPRYVKAGLFNSSGLALAGSANGNTDNQVYYEAVTAFTKLS